MPWDRGAWEKTTSGESNIGSYRSPPVSITDKPKSVSNKKNNYLKKLLNSFSSKGWKIPKKKQTQYLSNNYDTAPYRLPHNSAISEKISNLINTKPDKSKILVVSNNDLILDEIQLEFRVKPKYNIFKSSKSTTQLETLLNNVEKFEKTNSVLFNKYAIKLFSDVKSIKNISNLKILSENLYYIDNKNAKLLNDFLKAYWEFYEISNFSNIDLTLAEKDISSEVNNISKKLNSIKNYIKRLDKTLNLLDLNLNNLNEFDAEILKNNPNLVNSNEINSFLEVLEKYHKLNPSNLSSLNYFTEFPENNFIRGIIANFKRYINSQDEYNTLNQEILNLRNEFQSYGLHFNNLNEYYAHKDQLIKFSNASYLGDANYLILSAKIKEFLKLECSLKDYFEKCKKKIKFNSDSNLIYLNVNNGLKNILNICDNIGFKINSFSDLMVHKSDFEVLEEYVKFNKKNTVANEETIREYTMNLFYELKDICNGLINEDNAIDESELDYIIYNISNLNRVINKIGLNLHSLNEINDSFLIIANLENDTSSNIFTSQTGTYLQNETFAIHNDLDLLKNSLNYLLSILEDKPHLKEYPIDKLSQSFNNQFKIGFLKSNLESFMDSTNTFEEILENNEVIIQNAFNLIDTTNHLELKSKLDKISNELKSISQMHETQNYSGNQLMINNISSYKISITEEFNKLLQNRIFSKEKIAECDIEALLNELNNNIHIVKDYIVSNGLESADLNSIIKNNNEIMQNNDKFKSKIDQSTLYTFYETCSQLNNHDIDYELVNDILNLSQQLKVNEYAEFSKFSLDDLIDFSKTLDNNIEFSEYVDIGKIDKEFNVSLDQLNELNSKIEDIKTKFHKLKLDDSPLDDFSLIDITGVNEIKEKLAKIEEHLKINSTNVDELIENYKISLDMLLNLCKNHYIEFESDNHKFNSSDFLFNLEGIEYDFNSYIRLYELEKKIYSYDDLIQNNLNSIWNGPLTDLELVKNKLKIDEEFTIQYSQGIYTNKTLDNLSEVSTSDFSLLNDLKNMEGHELKSRYLLSYKNRDKLIPEINRLSNVNKDDLTSILEIFVNINKIYKSDEISDCITLLEYNIKHTDSIRLIREYENNLRYHSIVYYKFFNSRKFDMHIEEVITRLENHFKFTELIDLQIINERYLDEIKSNFNDFIGHVEKLDELKTEIIESSNKYYGDKNVTFNEIKENWTKLEDANLVLMDLKTLRNSFDSNYITYFDYVYVVDDNTLTGEDKLHLFLISKNRISTLKLMEG